MLLVLAPNLCLDRVVVVRDFATGRVHRAESAADVTTLLPGAVDASLIGRLVPQVQVERR